MPSIPIVGLETRRPAFRVLEPLRTAIMPFRETEHHALVTRVNKQKREIADLSAQLTEAEAEIAHISSERDKLKSQLGNVVAEMNQRLGTLEDSVAEKTGALTARSFVPPKP